MSARSKLQVLGELANAMTPLTMFPANVGKLVTFLGSKVEQEAHSDALQSVPRAQALMTELRAQLQSSDNVTRHYEIDASDPRKVAEEAVKACLRRLPPTTFDTHYTPSSSNERAGVLTVIDAPPVVHWFLQGWLDSWEAT